ncbi:MAG: hypothetical protein AEth_01142 [Candidatus Argoarchaeum ethanivorans]|uniref:Uncharacterized protein n=1 Tax=Candidatus Argoarchaeum ethanivorans TaxID=2608793 RepID=A0A8B3S1G3_9EURY|nr:MAG: hypothetical protein AEth_01142 [Candidatus Argoarchaeum ethanivorans]
MGARDVLAIYNVVNQYKYGREKEELVARRLRGKGAKVKPMTYLNSIIFQKFLRHRFQVV